MRACVRVCVRALMVPPTHPVALQLSRHQLCKVAQHLHLLGGEASRLEVEEAERAVCVCEGFKGWWWGGG